MAAHPYRWSSIRNYPFIRFVPRGFRLTGVLWRINMIKTEYIESSGKIYEVVGKDGAGRMITKLTNLTELPKDEPLPKPEESEETEAPKRRRRKV